MKKPYKPFGNLSLLRHSDSFLRHPDIVFSCHNPTISQMQPIQERQAAKNLGECSAVRIFKVCETIRIRLVEASPYLFDLQWWNAP